MQPITHVFEWADQNDVGRRTLFAEFAAVGAKHLVLTGQLMTNIMNKCANAVTYKKEMADAGLTFVDAHAPFGAWEDLCLPFEEYRPLMINRHKLALQVCNLMEVDTCCIHVGQGNAAYGAPNNVDALCNNITRALEELVPVAEKYGVVICIENIWSPINTPERLIAQVEHFNSPYLGVCYDSGHANIATRKRELENNAEKQWAIFGLPVVWDDKILEKLLPHIVNCHLHDNHGIVDEHILPGLGEIDWPHVVSLLKQAPRLRNIQSEVLSKSRPCALATRIQTFNNLFKD